MSRPDAKRRGQRTRDRRGEATVVVGFTGYSGVGKTSLLVRMIDALRRRGYAVGAVKHSSHGFLADRPGKDSFRLYESGAAAVALVSREQIATFTRCDPAGQTEVSLAAAMETLPRGLDVVLAEGFSWEPIPRVVLYPEEKEPDPDRPSQGEVIARVPVPAALPGSAPVFRPEQIEELLRKIEERVPGIRTQNGEEIHP
ncbi:MAG: molybdopterin-guanine dinucleotide biosynthesis protein B [Deltaproteobacteria bacterium]|nr:molybdopterin-guanine dinucleotide biosynthesis protein B [Deltaproteobacteria bacterium]MBW2418413.1 molybdopterin-guanine dinucleotide biosynthesis protein B [Deltaproteobacteria bacterium]